MTGNTPPGILSLRLLSLSRLRVLAGNHGRAIRRLVLETVNCFFTEAAGKGLAEPHAQC